MRKKTAYVWSLVAALMMTACSDQNENGSGSGEKSSLEFAMDFGEIANTRASSTAVPVTSWAKSIKDVQFFLYDATGVVKYSARVSANSNSGTTNYVYTDVPTGTFTMVAVANVHSATNPLYTTVPSLTGNVDWNASNVRQKNVSGLEISHKPAAAFPASIASIVPAALHPFETSSEIFMATHGTPVVIANGVSTDLKATPLKLKREVSMMRVRLNVADVEPGTENETSVDWADATVLIYNLPNKMTIQAGNAGGTSGTSTGTNVQIGATAFNTADPAAADYNPTVIIGGNFKKWKDIIVFPNNGGRVNNKPTPGDTDKATTAQKYTIIVTAKGKAGHKLADGTVLAADKMIYWDGLINEAFFPNSIREVNLTLKSGGKDGQIPTGPVEKGELEIAVSTPEPWDSNILETNLPL